MVPSDLETCQVASAVSSVPSATARPDAHLRESCEFQIDPDIQSVHALAHLHELAEQEITRHQRRIETLISTLSRPRTLYVMLAAVALWIGYNVVAPLLGGRCLDPPPFFWLQGVVGLAALLLTTMVLIKQQRQGKSAARRALLDLHVNLLSEQKVTKLIALMEELRRDLPQVHNRADPQAEAMCRPVDTHAVIARLEEHIEVRLGSRPPHSVPPEPKPEPEPKSAPITRRPRSG
jgi:uncharacterized membrane protein